MVRNSSRWRRTCLNILKSTTLSSSSHWERTVGRLRLFCVSEDPYHSSSANGGCNSSWCFLAPLLIRGLANRIKRISSCRDSNCSRVAKTCPSVSYGCLNTNAFQSNVAPIVSLKIRSLSREPLLRLGERLTESVVLCTLAVYKY